ncbi:MAG: peroxidase-related enzyme [Methanobacteriota archaeon]
MAVIRVVGEDEASGRLKEIYDEIRRARGSVADAMKVHSLLPETMEAHMRLYLAVQFGPKGEGGLGRPEREMLAVVVSAANRCDYCVAHHSDALGKYWEDADRVAMLARDFQRAGLTPAEEALCRFADRLTRSAGSVHEGDVATLRTHGFADEAILQAILTVSYFNFVNRLALATGIDPAEDRAKAYKY